MPAPAPPPPGHARAVALAGLLTILGTVVAMLVWFAVPSSGDGGRVSEPPAGGEPQPEQPAPPVADPTRVRVASRGIEARMVALGKRDDGTLDVPADAHTAGWWTGGASPGERGASVIAGHVDSRDGPGAFFRLADVRAGERVTVERADGSRVHFRVRGVQTHPKDAFPTEAVYGHTDAPTLRLVTCGGTFDPAARSYENNVIVFADLETDEARVNEPAPGAVTAGKARVVDGATPDGPLAGAPREPDGRGVPIGLATLSVVGTAAAVTCRALQHPGDAAG